MDVLPSVLNVCILAFLDTQNRLKCLHLNKEWFNIVTNTIVKYQLPYDWSKLLYNMACATYSIKYADIPNIHIWFKLPWNQCWHIVELLDVADDEFKIKLPKIVQNDFYSKSIIHQNTTMIIDFNDSVINPYSSIAPCFRCDLFQKCLESSKASHSNQSSIIFPKFLTIPFAGDFFNRCLVDVELTQHVWNESLLIGWVLDNQFVETRDVWNHSYCENVGWQCGVVDWREYNSSDRNGNRRQVPVWCDITLCVYATHECCEDMGLLDILLTGASIWCRIYFFAKNFGVAPFGTHTSLKQQTSILATPLFGDNIDFDYKTAKFLQKPSLGWTDIVDKFMINSPHLEWDNLLTNEINLQNLLCIRQFNGLLCLACFVKYGNDFWLITENNEKFAINLRINQTNKVFSMVYKATQMYKNSVICASIDDYLNDLPHNHDFNEFLRDWITVKPTELMFRRFCGLRVQIPYFFLNTNNNNNNNTYEWVGNNKKSPKIDWDAWSHMLRMPVNTTTWQYGISYDENDDIIKQNGCIGVWIDITDAISQINVKLWKNKSHFVTNTQKTKVFGKFFAMFEGCDEIAKL